jgi:hypothetical protein
LGFLGNLKPLKALSVSPSHNLSNLREALQFSDNSNLPQEETNFLEEAGCKTSLLRNPGSHNNLDQSSGKTSQACKQHPSARHNKAIRGFLDSQFHSEVSNSNLNHSRSFNDSSHFLGVRRSNHLDSLEQASPATYLANINNSNHRCSKLNLNLANLTWFHSLHKDLLARPNLLLLLDLEEDKQGSLGINWVKMLKHKVSLPLRQQVSPCSNLNQGPASSLNNNLLLSNNLQVASLDNSPSQHSQHRQQLVLGNSLGNLNHSPPHRLELKAFRLNKQVLYSPNLYRVFRTSLRVLPLAYLGSRPLQLSLSHKFLNLLPQSLEGDSLPSMYQPQYNLPLSQPSTQPACSSNSPQLNK